MKDTLLNTGAVKKLTNGLKALVDFRQGRVNARRYLSQQHRLTRSLSRNFQKKVSSALKKTTLIVADDIKNGIEPDYGRVSLRLNNELNATLKTQIQRVFSTVYSLNLDKYKVNQKAAVGFDFEESAEFQIHVNKMFRERAEYMRLAATHYSKDILDRVNILRNDGVGVDGIAKSIVKDFGPISRNRAALIARTETHSAVGSANFSYHSDISKTYGIQMMKQWQATSDARTRSAHAAMSGKKVGMDEGFTMPNGSVMKYVGDPAGGAANVINCRCVIIYVESQDEVVNTGKPEFQESTDSLGRPIPMSADAFRAGFLAKGLEDNFSASKRSMKQRVKDNAEEWPDQRGTRFSGRSKTDFAKVSSGLEKNLGADAATKAGAVMLDQAVKETDAFAALFGVPKLRGLKLVRSTRSRANMGDGVMGVNPKGWLAPNGRAMLNSDKASTSKWKQGDSNFDKPHSTAQYYADPLDRIRSTVYHEFGHLIHQNYKVAANSGSYFSPVVERWFSRKKLKGTSASKYANKNAQEWFAENFSLWAQRKDDLVAPRFKKLIEAMLNGADELSGI
jgi:hypothetical protein